MKKLIQACEYLLFLIFLVIIFFTKQKQSIILTIPIIIFLSFFTKKVKIKKYSLFLFIIAFTIRIITVLFLKVEITDDFKTMYEASKNLLVGNMDFMNSFYFHTYPFQLGLTLYQAILLKVVNSVVFLKIANSIYTSLIVMMIYKISRKLFKEETARLVSLGYIFYLYPLYLNSVLTNQHIPALLMLIVIYLIITKEETKKNSVIIALLLGLANFFRTESIIFLTGIIIYYIINFSKENYKKKIFNIVVLVLTYFLFTTATTQMLIHSPLYTTTTSDQSYDKNVTLWKFYCGLSTKHNGIYNEEDASKYFASNNKKKLLANRIKRDYKKYPVLFLKKEVILWTQTNYDLRITSSFNQNIYKFLLDFNQGYLNLIMLLFVVSLYPFKKLKSDNLLLIKIILGLYTCIYAFIEISPRYAYILHILIFLIIGVSIEKIKNLLKMRRSKDEQSI